MDPPYPKGSTLTFPNTTQYELGKILNARRKNDEFCDLHLVVNGRKVPAHKAVVAAASPYFDTMFKSQFMDSDSSTIDMTHIFNSADTLEDIVSFLYEDKIDITDENIECMLNGGALFQIDRLRNVCTQYMLWNLGLQNALRNWALAELYSLGEISSLCEFIVKNRFHDYFISHESALEISKEFLSHMIQKGVFDNISTLAKSEFLLNWMNYSKTEREPEILDIFAKCPEHLTLGQIQSNMTVESLINFLEKISTNGADVEKTHTNEKSKLSKFKSKRLRSKAQLVSDTSDIVVCMVKKQKKGGYRTDGPKGNVYLHGYIPSKNSWLYLGDMALSAEDYTNIKAFRGFTQQCAVFQLKSFPIKVGIWHFESDSYAQLLPPHHMAEKKDIRHYGDPQFFCFDGKVFCLLSQMLRTTTKSKKKTTKLKKANESFKENSHTTVRSLHVLEDNNTWSLCGHVSKSSATDAGFFCSYEFDVLVTKDETYLLSNVNQNFPGYSKYSELNVYVVKREKNSYSISELPAPKPSHHWKLGCSLGISTAGKLMISVKPDNKYQRIEQVVLNKNKNNWTQQRSEAALVNSSAPDILVNNLRPAKTEYSANVPVKNLKRIYAVEFPAPFVSRLQCHENSTLVPKDATKNWKTLPGPPVLNVYSVNETYIPTKLLSKFTQTKTFYDQSIDGDKCPFLSVKIRGLYMPLSFDHFYSKGEIRNNPTNQERFFFSNRYVYNTPYDDPFRDDGVSWQEDEESYSSNGNYDSDYGFPGFDLYNDEDDDIDSDDGMYF